MKKAVAKSTGTKAEATQLWATQETDRKTKTENERGNGRQTSTIIQ